MLLKTKVLQALVFQEMGKDTKALELIASIMPLVEQEGYFRLFLNEGPRASRLLYKAVSAGISPDYAGRILAGFPACPEGTRETGPGKGLVEPLSPREIQVLRQIATGSSNKEAAGALFISEGTVKNHLKNIFGKLDVNNRTGAVERARNLGLLD